MCPGEAAGWAALRFCALGQLQVPSNCQSCVRGEVWSRCVAAAQGALRREECGLRNSEHPFWFFLLAVVLVPYHSHVYSCWGCPLWALGALESEQKCLLSCDIRELICCFSGVPFPLTCLLSLSADTCLLPGLELWIPCLNSAVPKACQQAAKCPGCLVTCLWCQKSLEAASSAECLRCSSTKDAGWSSIRNILWGSNVH